MKNVKKEKRNRWFFYWWTVQAQTQEKKEIHFWGEDTKFLILTRWLFVMFSNCFISDSCASVRGKIFNSMLLFRYAKKRGKSDSLELSDIELPVLNLWKRLKSSNSTLLLIREKSTLARVHISTLFFWYRVMFIESHDKNHLNSVKSLARNINF